jgi:aminocarboxymuconate-semialdehyde decarboxylase
MAGVIDLHAHVVLADAFETAGPYGPFHGDDSDGRQFFRVGDYTMKPIPYRGSVFMDVERRLAEMERVGIDRQMLSPNPLTFFGGVQADHAVDFARATNDGTSRMRAPPMPRIISCFRRYARSPPYS